MTPAHSGKIRSGLRAFSEPKVRVPVAMILEDLRIERIPSVPEVLVTLLKLCHKPQVEFEELARVIEREPALSGKVLHLAGTACYRQWAEVTQIRRLLVVLGLNTVRRLALTSAVHQYFSQLSPGHESFTAALWFRSLLCAHLARDLARLTGYPAEEEAYLAGLLHRLGQLVLLANFPEPYQDILFMDETEARIEHVERDRFATTAAEVGAELLRRWPTSPFLADAVRYQNFPQSDLGESPPLVKLLNLATRLSRGTGANAGALLPPDLDDRLFGLNATLLAEVFHRARAEVLETARGFAIDLGVGPRRDPSPAREELADYTRNLALLGGTGGMRPACLDTRAALERIRRDLALVFALDEVEFFLCDTTGERLLGQPSSSRPACTGFSLDWRRSASLLGRALREERPLSSFDSDDETEALVDEQLRRLLKTPGLLVLPLIAEQVPLGAVVAGIPSSRCLPLAEWGTGLNLFAGQLALLLLQARETEAARDAEESAGRQWRNLEVRKLLHEVNNPLAVITNYLHVLGLKLGEGGPVKELAVLREELARVGDLLARFKDLEQPPAPGEERLELNRTITDLCAIFADGLFQGKKIRAEFDRDESIPPLALSPGALRQVVMNLLKNAAEALPEGGRIHLATRDRIHKNGALFVELRIGDNGPGLPEQVLNGLFTPVTSAKPGHAGLGLSIVKQLLDQLGAEISCASSPEAGTRFQILLPRTLSREASNHD